MATYSVTENASFYSSGGAGAIGWGNYSTQLGTEIPVTVSIHTIDAVYTEYYWDAFTATTVKRQTLRLNGEHTHWPNSLSWVDTQFTYNRSTTSGYTVTYNAGTDKTSFYGPETLYESPNDADGYINGQSYSPVITGFFVDHYLQGLGRDANGYIVITTSGAVDHYLHGLPFSAADSLCVEVAAVVSWSNGWPLTSNGKVAIA